MIQETTIHEIRDTNLVDIIGQYLKLKRSGNEYVGLCPFHDEKTPSFNVHPSKGYYCHGCGASGGNAIDFIMAYEQKDFPDAVIHVAGMAGIFIDENTEPIKPKIKPIQPIKPKSVDYIPGEKVSRNLAAYGLNNLYKFFVSLFSDTTARNVFQKYGVGSSKYFGKGTTLFVQRDINGNVRQVKAMMYSSSTGKRNRDKKPLIIGRSDDLMGKDANLVQCFFGEHLLRENEGKPVAIVESEKTACICSIYYPKYLWIATGGKNGCSMINPQVNRALHGRSLHLFPDVDGVNDWHKIADELRQQGFDVFPNNVIAKYAAPGSKEDIADYLIKFDVKDFREPNVPAKPAEPDYPPSWDNCKFDPTDKWQALNHAINVEGEVPPKHLTGKVNSIVEQFADAGLSFEQIKYERI